MVVSSSKTFIVLVFCMLGVVFCAALVFYSRDFDFRDQRIAKPYHITQHLPVGSPEKTYPIVEPQNSEPAVAVIPTIPSPSAITGQDTETLVTDSTPNNVLLDVPFAPQSPYALWDERDEESCEEASLIIVHYYLKKKDLSSASMRRELDTLIEYEIENFKNFKDTDAYGIAHLAREYFGYSNSRAEYNITVEDIKEEILKGHPVIVPAAGRELKNPYYKAPGPLYHNLVIVGFNQEGFFTNDPGTKRGKNYFYPTDILFNAIHDFPGVKEYILDGRKAMIIVE